MKKKTRSILMVNKSLSTGLWNPIPIQHSDITAVQLTGPFRTLQIINLYVDCNHNNALNALKNYLKSTDALLTTKVPLNYIWVGDFNWHHPLWDDP